MKNIHLIAGLPRSGSSLLCNILNMNPNFYATSTSPMVDILRNIRTTFSHNPTFKTHNRLEEFDSMRKGMKGFINGFYEDKNIVFDKSRGWTTNLMLLDEILGHKNTKVIWTYRDPIDVVSSIEKRHRETILLESIDEPNFDFSTLEKRVEHFIGDGGLVGRPVKLLEDIKKMGYSNRILIVKYKDLTENPQLILNQIHEFLGEENYNYNKNNFTDLKQTIFEMDSYYNYKFMHDIIEGKIFYKKHENILTTDLIERINKRFSWINSLIKN